MQRHVIVEGMDGSGKDTLIGHLAEFYKVKVVLHPRASTSLGGPVASLDEWVEKDIHHLMHDNPPRYLYNRHPLISEPGYAPHRKVNPGMRGHFLSPEWLALQRRLMAHRSILVICQPPYSEIERVLNEQGAGAHMPGVIENRRPIWGYYTKFVWPGITIRYNRETSSVRSLISTIEGVRHTL